MKCSPLLPRESPRILLPQALDFHDLSLLGLGELVKIIRVFVGELFEIVEAAMLVILANLLIFQLAAESGRKKGDHGFGFGVTQTVPWP